MATETGTGESLERDTLLNDPKVYEEAEADPAGWWAKQAEELHRFEKWERVLDLDDAPFAKWFVGGKLNVSYNCLDRHVEAASNPVEPAPGTKRVGEEWKGPPRPRRTRSSRRSRRFSTRRSSSRRRSSAKRR